MLNITNLKITFSFTERWRIQNKGFSESDKISVSDRNFERKAGNFGDLLPIYGDGGSSEVKLSMGYCCRSKGLPIPSDQNKFLH